MDRLLARLRRIRSSAGRNHADIDSLIHDVEGLSLTATASSNESQDPGPFVPGAWPHNDHAREVAHDDVSASQHHSPSVTPPTPDVENTDSDAMIAALLAAEDAEDSQGEHQLTTPTEERLNLSCEWGDVENDERLETATAIALIDSLDEIAEYASATAFPPSHPTTEESGDSSSRVGDSSWIQPLRDIAAAAPSAAAIAQARVQQCPICWDSFEDANTGDQSSDDESVVTVHCPACIQPFHIHCLSSALRTDRRCPTCRTTMEDEFVEDLPSSVE